MSSPTETIFVVDDDFSVRKSLGRLLQTAGFAVETFDSAETYLARDPYDGVGCIVLDLAMPSLSGLELQTVLAERRSDLPVIFVTGHGDVPASVRALKQGAIDFLTKPVDEAALLEALTQALAQHRARRDERTAEDAIVRQVAMLSPRELEVTRLVIAGLLNKQIAARLGIGEKTVKVHRARVMGKMGVRSVAELVRMCAAAGLEPEPRQEPRQEPSPAEFGITN